MQRKRHGGSKIQVILFKSLCPGKRLIYDEDFDEILEPEAKEINTIRNYIEHKAFKVVLDKTQSPFKNGDDLSYSITREEFEYKVMKLMKLARAAIIYLSLAINREEKNKDNSNKPSGKIDLSKIPNSMKV